MASRRLILALPIIIVIALGAAGAYYLRPDWMRPRVRPTPTVADYVYGHDSPRQKLDFWQAKSDKPTPVVLLVHGGGWMEGDKTIYVTRWIQPFLDAGISVAAVNYRFLPEATEQGIEPPVKACNEDVARAVQTIRSKAKEWNIDPTRIGANGNSAGACSLLWLALHDDLADPASSDPEARESSRLTCAAVRSAQTSLDPRQVREWIPNAEYGGGAFGFSEPGRERPAEFELALENRDKIEPWIKEYSPIELVTPDDPPLYLDYPLQERPPRLGQPEEDPTHAAVYGLQLAERLNAAGVEAVVTYPGHDDPRYGSIHAFLIDKLRAK
jgi:acetyl esterase/lipase